MSVTASDATAVARPDPELHELAATAQRALACDAVVITERPPGLRIAAAHGIAHRDLAPVAAALLAFEHEFGTGDYLSLTALASGLPAAAQLVEQGFVSISSTAAVFEGQRLGTLHALGRVARPLASCSQLETFARHSAVALVHRRVQHREAMAADQLQSLRGLDLLAISARNLEELIGALNTRVAPMLGVGMTGVMVWDDDRQVLQMVAGSFGASEEIAASYQISATNTFSNAARVFTTGRPYLSNDASRDPGILQDYVDYFHIQRLLSLPLIVERRAVGVLHLANKATDFTIADVVRAESIAAGVASAVQLGREMFSLRRQQELEGILGRVAVSIASGESIQDFLSPALRDLCIATQAGVLALVPDGYDPIVLRTVEGCDELEAAVLQEARGEPGRRAYVVGPQHAGDPGWAAFHVPVRLGPQRLGTLTALRVRGEPFGPDERNAFARVSHLAALAWASERYQRQRAKLARLEERQRIADDLHDDVAQILFAAQLQLDALLESDDVSPAAAERAARARGLLIRGDTAIRTVIHELSRQPGADLGTRLEQIVSAVEQEYAVAVHVDVDDAAAAAVKRLPRAAVDALAKIAREALINAAKHAGPCRVIVRLELSGRGRLVLRVVDDGLGMHGSRGHNGHGLSAMRRTLGAHGGTVRVLPGQTGGTKVIASLPV